MNDGHTRSVYAKETVSCILELLFVKQRICSACWYGLELLSGHCVFYASISYPIVSSITACEDSIIEVQVLSKKTDVTCRES
jgi:hypothetical protein